METLERVIEIFNEIQNTSGKNDKIDIIRRNEGNLSFKACLRFLLDGNITSGISTKKYDKISASGSDLRIHGNIIEEFLRLLNYVSVHNTGRDEDVLICKSWCFGMEENIQDFVRNMITKSIKLGADAKLVNTAIPNLIPTFDVMLGTPIEKCKLKPSCWISLSRKLNGTRAAFVSNKLMTRQGKQYSGVEHIINDLISMGCEEFFIDGELLYKNEEGLSDSEAFQKGTGIAMSKDVDKSCLKLVVFDIFPLNEFWNGISTKTYKERKNDLFELGKKIKESGTKNIELVPIIYEGSDHSKIDEWLNFAEEHDWEGIMVNLDTPYECKRTKNLIKVKRFFTVDLLCTDIGSGTGKNENTLGFITCDYKGYPLGVGSGFTDEQRNYYWNNPEEIVGKIVEVRYKEETKNKDGGLSLQFPTIVSIRKDKSEPSYN